MPAAAKQTKVVTQFTDKAGRTWKVGEDFKGDEKATRDAITAGQVQEQPAEAE